MANGKKPAAAPGQLGFNIRTVYTMIGGNFQQLKESVRKKTLKNSRQAAIWLWRAARKQVRRSSSSKQVIEKPMKIWFPKQGKQRGTEIRKTPEEWMKGKRSVAPAAGRGGRKRVTVQDSDTYRWNKSSKPGTSPMTHPANQPGWQNEWLKNSILFDENEGKILIYANPAPPGKRVKSGPKGPDSKLIPRDLEFGGVSVRWSRKIHVGYVVSTIRSGTRAYRGDGAYIWGKKQNDGEKHWRDDLTSKGNKRGRWVNKNTMINKSGRTRRDHVRKFKETRVALTNEYDWIGGTFTLDRRPFMRPVQAAFFRDYFPQLYKNMIGDE